MEGIISMMQDKDLIGRRLTQKCHSESFALVILSEAKNLVVSLRAGSALPSFAKICVLILLFLCPCIAHSEIYKWVDDKGEVHFTDNLSVIPEQYLNQIQRMPVKETKEKISPESPVVKEKEVKVETPPPPVKAEAEVKEGISPDDPNAVTIDGDIKQEGKEKMVIYSGSAKNNSNTELNNVEITFTVRGRDGKEENLSLPVKGKKGEGVLESGEVGSFTVQPDTSFPSIAGYGYNFKWKFTKTQQK